MARAKERVAPDLQDWSEISELDWSGILVGNGASRAVWERFAYGSLFKKAASKEITNPLSRADLALFKALDTTNFESVLGALATADTVCEILGQETAEIRGRYGSIRRALVQAVHSRHLPWVLASEDVLEMIREELLRYDFVYSTNYDLLIYWAIMTDGGGGFKDYFWSGRFDVTNVEIWDKVTKVVYLHGALHLYRTPDGGTLKDRAGEFDNLLDRFGQREDGVPLFISEGSAADKLGAIARSDYLSFGFQQFSQHQGPLVVFGHALGDTDRHLANVLKRWGNRRIAVSVFPDKPADVVEFKARIIGQLPEADLLFFDSTTHPLGDPELRIEEDERGS